MADVTGTLETIAGGNPKLVLRPRKMAVLVAPETAPPITTIVNAGGTALSIPDVYKSVGYLSKDDGLGLSPSIEKSPSTAYGQTQPINQYITESPFTAAFTMKETKKVVLETYYSMDMSGVQAAATTRELKWDVPDQPEVRYPRILIVGQHRDGADAIYVAHFMPRATIDDIGDQSWNDDGDLEYPVTYTALVDATLGTSRRPFIAGPGLTPELVTAMGFTVAA